MNYARISELYRLFVYREQQQRPTADDYLESRRRRRA